MFLESMAKSEFKFGKLKLKTMMIKNGNTIKSHVNIYTYVNLMYVKLN